MRSLILQSATRYLAPLLLIFSVVLLSIGHHKPGGGFVGGLVASAAFSLYGIAFGIDSAKRTLVIKPQLLITLGLTCVATSGIISFLLGEPFLSGLWGEFELPGIGALGTPVLFDSGVYLGVVGVVLLIVFSLSEEE
jgi:multicomponent Na+:H+ antiporter subunit B